MNITIFGALGNVGRRVAAEAASRGHEVTEVSRTVNPHDAESATGGVRRGDAASPADVARLSAGQDVVVSAVRFGSPAQAQRSTRATMDGLADRRARLLVVGGAASLLVPGTGGRLLLDDPDFLPKAYRHVGEISMAQYRACVAERRVDWAYLSPPADLVPGARTGRYRLGRDELLLDRKGHSRISLEDLAVALLDEAEEPRHHRTRFTVAW